LLFALAVWSCGGGEPTQPARPDAGMPSPGRPDAGSTGGTVINAPDNQAQRWVSSDPRYSSTWTFELRQQAAIPVGAREVYVEVRGCRKSYEPPGAIRFRTPESTSSRESSVDRPLCENPCIPSAQVWLPVAEPPRLVVEAVRLPTGATPTC
jgi:hypothetical protein